ncbi:MAG TPA: HEAT repeat domain-containing protein [Gemmataceae bacterium]|nr:HEAT repeat domain-containing protein [Gemmataceae bacterium]
MARRALLIAAMAGLLLAADAPKKDEAARPAKEGDAFPEGAIHVALPPGTVRWERIFKKGRPLLRVSVGKTVVESRRVFIGDGKMATEFEATEEGVRWPSAQGGKGSLMKEGAVTYEPGKAIGGREGKFLPVDRLKAGSVWLTTSSIKFDFRPAAKKPEAPAVDRKAIDRLIAQLGSDTFNERAAAARQLVALGEPVVPALRKALASADREIARRARACIESIEQEVAKGGPYLPEGVCYVALPPGTVRWERVFRQGRPLLRVSVGRTVVESRNVFIGDGKAATMYEATKEGIHWPTIKGGRGPLLKDGTMTWEPGGGIGVEGGDFLIVDRLKSGVVYLTTPDTRFDFQPAPKVKERP